MPPIPELLTFRNHYVLFATVFLSILLVWGVLFQFFSSDPHSWYQNQKISNTTSIDVLRNIDADLEMGAINISAGIAVEGGEALNSNTVDVSFGDEGNTSVAVSASERGQYLYPGSFSSVLGTKCIQQLWGHCNNGGADRCRWRNSACNFNNNDCYNLTKIFPNRSILFRGDSTLREQFSVWSFYCCPWASPVLKVHTNMTARNTLARHHQELGLKSFFHFDYLFDHLLEPVPNLPVNQTLDAVVVGLGMYQAKAITTQQKDAQSIEEIRTTKIQKIVESICDFHKAKVGFYIGGWMECSAMKKHKAKTVRQNARVCSPSASIVSGLNRMIKKYLSTQQPRKDGCYVHYIPPMKCKGQKHTCTGDGVHGRSNGQYGNTKFQLLFNAAKILFQTAPPGR